MKDVHTISLSNAKMEAVKKTQMNAQTPKLLVIIKIGLYVKTVVVLLKISYAQSRIHAHNLHQNDVQMVPVLLKNLPVRS
jgi:hypothetical protein